MKQVRCSPATWALLRALKRTGLLQRINLRVTADLAGARRSVPINGGVGLNLLVADEPWMDPLLHTLLTHFPGTFVDVGVNVGQTLCAVKAIEPERAYVGFEPDPACAHHAQELSLRYRFPDVRIVPAGLSDREGVLTLEAHSAEEADSTATLVPNMRPGHPVHRRKLVPVIRFERAAADLGIPRVGVLKIDVEGGELHVLHGLGERLRSDRPAVVIEILPPGRLADRLERQVQVEQLFREADLVLHRIRPTVDGLHLERLSGPIGVHDDLSLANYVALPTERCTEIADALTSATGQQYAPGAR